MHQTKKSNLSQVVLACKYKSSIEMENQKIVFCEDFQNFGKKKKPASFRTPRDINVG